MFNVTFTAAFIAGLVSFLAPCTFVTLPYFLASLTASAFGNDASQTGYKKKVFFSAILYVLGFLVVFTLLGYSANTIGNYLDRNRELFLQISGILVVLFGLIIVAGDKIPLLFPFLRTKQLQFSKVGASYWTPFIIGITSAFSWTPCIGPILGTILLIASFTSTRSIEGAMLLFTYGLGIMIPFLLLAVVFAYSQNIVKKLYKVSAIIYKVTGIFLILLGITILTGYSGVIFGNVNSFFIELGYRPA